MKPQETRAGWQYWNVADLIAAGTLQVGDGYRAKNSELWGDGLPFARAGNINGGFHFEDADILNEESVRLAGEKVSQPGDVTFTSKGTFGRFAFVDESTPRFVYSPQLCYWRVVREGTIDRRFLYYWMQGTDCMNQLNEVKGLTDMADYVSLSNQRRMWLSAPDLAVQRRIADVLSAYDELIDNNQRRIQILESMARALYREWFVNFRFPGHEKVRRVPSELGEIPEGWRCATIGECASYINRGLSPNYLETGGSLVINQKCIRDQRLSLDPARRQSKPIPDEKRVRFGDVLVNSTGVGTLGRVAQVYQNVENCTVDSHVTIVRPGETVDADFFGCALMARQDEFERLGIGATNQTELGRSAIAGLSFALPGSRLQQQFGSLVRPMRAAVQVDLAKIENLRRTRDLLLPRLLSGQIEVDTN